MARALSKISKRKHAKVSQEVSSGNSKENSPCITTHIEKDKKLIRNCSITTTAKENIIESQLQISGSSPSNERTNIIRKSERRCKPLLNNKDYVYDLPKNGIKAERSAKRNVLSDKTNSTVTRGIKTNTQSQSRQNDTINTCHLNEICADRAHSKPHIPVYKAIKPSDVPDAMYILPSDKKETVYEFDEVDENEEPNKKRKKKKKTNVRKPRIGPKALTINNIKYSSTESLVSLPEKPVRQRKQKNKKLAQYKTTYTSLNGLNDSENTLYSVQSFTSHPPSLVLNDRKGLKIKHELSVLQETQSENCLSPNEEITNNLNSVEENQFKILGDYNMNSDPEKMSAVLPTVSLTSQNNSAVSQQRCYPSKRCLSDSSIHRTSQFGSITETLPNQISHCSANISTGSSHDFLSSTPCKRTSLVVRHNSVFNDSYERDIPTGLRPSTGFTRDTLENMVTEDNCFGFDEPEELEEPLVSPIKNINLQPPRTIHRHRHELAHCNKIVNPKTDVKDVIEMLKSSIPKAQIKISSQALSSDSSSADDSHHMISPCRKEDEAKLSFIKPPRRSYERQRRIRHYSEHESGEAEDEESDKENDCYQKKHEKEDQVNMNKATKKYYQKKNNVSKMFKAPQLPKAKQRILKEEEELERLAAQMNAQFQEIEKNNLMVE